MLLVNSIVGVTSLAMFLVIDIVVPVEDIKRSPRLCCRRHLGQHLLDV